MRGLRHRTPRADASCAPDKTSETKNAIARATRRHRTTGEQTIYNFFLLTRAAVRATTYVHLTYAWRAMSALWVPGETLRREASFPRSPGPGTKPSSEQTDGRGTRALCGRRRCVPILHKGSTYNRDLYKRAEGWGVVGPCQGATTTTGERGEIIRYGTFSAGGTGGASRGETRKERREQGRRARQRRQ